MNQEKLQNKNVTPCNEKVIDKRDAKSMLNELGVLGFTLEPSPEGLRYYAPRDIVTSEMITKLREYKASLLNLLNRRCPYCHRHGMRRERKVVDGLVFLEAFCLTCRELVEWSMPVEQFIQSDRRKNPFE